MVRSNLGGAWRASRAALSRCALLSGAASLSGCALLPGVPVGPSHGPSVRVGMVSGYTYAPASARLLQPGASVEQEGNAGNYGGGGVAGPLPQRLAARFSTGRYLDVGGDIGWLDRGLQIRFGPLHADRPLPGGLEIEWRTGSTSGLVDNHVVEQAEVLRARVELYPPLGFGRAKDGSARAFGVLAAGMSQGRRLVPYPSSAGGEAFFESYSYTEGQSMNVLRTETRLELALGIHWQSLPVTSTLVLLPWFTVGKRNAQLRCEDCVNVELERLTANWGIALALDAGLLFRTAD